MGFWDAFLGLEGKSFTCYFPICSKPGMTILAQHTFGGGSISFASLGLEDRKGKGKPWGR